MNLILFEQSESHCPDGKTPPTAAGGKTPPVTADGKTPPTAADDGDFFLPRRDERAVHLLKVLRKKEGDSFDAGILGGRLGTGVIRQINAQGMGCSLSLDTAPPSRTPLRLGVGFPRPIQLRRLLRDCASLGLQAVDLVSTELGEKSYRDTKLLDDGGARAALIEGAVQARDTRLPELAQYPSLAAWLAAIRRNAPPRERSSCKTTRREGSSNERPLFAAADNVAPQGTFSGIAAGSFSSAVLAIGSERGWSGQERTLLEEAGFIRLSMGTRALRTETACTAAAVLLMDRMGLLCG